MAYLIMLMHMAGDCRSDKNEAEVDCARGRVRAEQGPDSIPDKLITPLRVVWGCDIQLRPCNGIFGPKSLYLVSVSQDQELGLRRHFHDFDTVLWVFAISHFI